MDDGSSTHRTRTGGRRRALGVGVAILTAVALATGRADAHELVGTRFDAPLPLGLLYAGAGATVAVTAGWLARSDPVTERRLTPRRLGTIRASAWHRLRDVASGLFLVAFVLVLVAGLTGPQVRAENVATLFTWPLWLKGVGLLAALVGSPWRVLSPWRTLYRLLARLEGEAIAVLGSYPAWLGVWPALAGYLLWLGVVENLTTIPRSPRATVSLLAGYAVVMLLGGVAFGEDWFERADALAVLYRLFGRVAPLRLARTDDAYRLTLRPPWRGCLAPVPGTATVWFVVATVYTVSFDGFTATASFQSLYFAARDGLGTGALTGPLLYAVGFAAFVAAFVVVSRAASRAGDAPTVPVVRALAPTVLPIAVAYEVAHNYAFVLTGVGPLVEAAGGVLLATPPSPDLLGWLTLPAFWVTQVVLVVAGHVVAVVAAHRVTRDRFPDANAALRAHLPVTALMVAYTVVSLWIISQPLVR